MNTNVFNEFIGKKWNVDVNESKLKEKVQYTEIRVLKPLELISMDYRKLRINIHIDNNEIITDINFG